MPRDGWQLAILVIACVVGAACATPPGGRVEASGPATTACTEPRPQICTANYDPVCARLGDGTYATYANACMACGDGDVSGHRPGPCD